ncbi:MAG: glycosyltransferase [Vicinamibacterales bacterium]
MDTAFYVPDGTTPEPFALIVSALVPYKRIELAIEACHLAHLPLKIVGDGPERATLERQANGRAEFLGRVSNEEIRSLYRRAALVLLPGEEDFGIVPLEAQACGRPVVALNRGGSIETVIAGTTGVLVDDLSVDAFTAGIDQAMRTAFDSSAIRAHAERFSRERFGDEIEALVRGPIEADAR